MLYVIVICVLPGWRDKRQKARNVVAIKTSERLICNRQQSPE